MSTVTACPSVYTQAKKDWDIVMETYGLYRWIYQNRMCLTQLICSQM